MTTLHQHTLFHLVDSIKLKRFKLSRDRSRTPQTDEDQQKPNSKYWTKQEERLFFNILMKYGADYSVLKHHFPSKSRKQIKRKCTQIQQRRKNQIQRIQKQQSQKIRKDFFDQQVMQLDMIKWHNSKPNKPETVTEPSDQ